MGDLLAIHEAGIRSIVELTDLTIPLGSPQAAPTAIHEAVALLTAACRPDTARAPEAAGARVIAVAAGAAALTLGVAEEEAEAMEVAGAAVAVAVTANVESSVFGFKVARH
jgi:hypothetical protein